MKVSVPASAPAVPPDTGASSMASPLARFAAATSLETSGAIVLQSTSNVPERQLARMPAAPR